MKGSLESSMNERNKLKEVNVQLDSEVKRKQKDIELGELRRDALVKDNNQLCMSI
jgi:hypothetical protein